jgi:hypothetical protein
MIDRFDARSELDFIRDPLPDAEPDPEETQLKEALNFERYRDLVVASFRGSARTHPI